MANRQKIKLTSYDELLGVNKDGTIEVEISRLHSFKNHPFKVVDDEKMNELAESIKLNGVLSPALARMREDGDYELISGHRRRRACEIAGISKMPVIVKELSDDEATILMVDANIQREEILPSEKAFAFKMKMEAMSHQGKNEGTDLTADVIGRDNGVSGRQVQRYIRLTLLIPELLQLVDDKKLSLVMGVNISYFEDEFQQIIYENMLKGNYINNEQIKELRNSDEVTVEDLEDLLNPNMKVKKLCKVTLTERKLAKYFPTDATRQDMEEVIFTLLDKWKSESD